MYIKIKDKEYEVATNLGTTLDLETKYKKKVRELLSDIEDYTVEQLINILYVGFKRKNPSIDQKTFSEMLLDDEDFNYMSFIREISVFCNLCMSMKADENEVRERINKIYDKNLEEVEEEIEHIEDKEENEKN